MTAALDDISSVEAGERLRIAREAAKLTQAAAATAAKMARTTLVAIEQGQRRVRIEELLQLAKAYGSSVNALLRQEAVHIDLVAKFRKLATHIDPAVDAAATLLTNLAKAEVELEALLGLRHIRNYPQQRGILPGDVRLQAEQDALEVRQWLGLGLAPVPDLPAILEMQLGVRVFMRALDNKISGLYAFDEAVGACMLFNADHPRGRRNWTAAHELGHLVATRAESEVLTDASPNLAREERYANAFASGFLTPARSVMQQYAEITIGSSRLTRRHVIMLAFMFAVSREAMVRRLEALKLAKPGTWDWFQARGGITDVQARQVLGDSRFNDIYGVQPASPLGFRINSLAAAAWREELMSEAQLARLLHVGRVEIREILDGADDDAVSAGPVLELHG